MIILEVSNNKIICLYNNSALSLNTENQYSFQQLKHDLSAIDDNVLLLPALSLLNKHTALICSNSSINKLKELTKSEPQIIPIPDGSVEDEIDESEINKVLRKVFSLKPNKIFICLPNPHHQPLVEKNLYHVLRGAGYNPTTSSRLLVPYPE